MSKCALRHDEVAAMREGGADLDGDGVADDVDAREPPMNTRAEAKAWRKWAHERAKVHADTCHPRLQQKDGRPKPLPMRAKPNDLLEQIGIVPALYLDFLKFGFGYCLLGLLLTGGTSLVVCILNAPEAYDRFTLSTYPTFFSALTIGTRTECDTPLCQTVTFATAIAEVVFSLMLLAGTIAFRRRAHKLQEMNDDNNVYTREYAVQLHGMPKNATAEEVKKHVEKCLAEYGKTPQGTKAGEKWYRVWDVALMTDCATVLRQALKQAPLERRWAILHKRLQTLRAFQVEHDTGWGLHQRIGETRDDTDSTAEKLMAVRKKISKKGCKTVTDVCGAFIIFDEQPAAHACLSLFGGSSLKYAMQKKALRLRGRRLRAYPATQPRDVLYANLPYRILALNCRGFNTFLRRFIAKMLLAAFMAISFSAILIVNSLKSDLTASSDGGPSMLSAFNIPSSMVALVEGVLPTVASLFVVVVNQAIIFLVGALGKFERHPTLSGMHKSKLLTILIAVAFNTGFLPLIVSMAPPPAWTVEHAADCMCESYFCCWFGSRGVLMRGEHITMTKAWHKDVGTMMVSTLLIQSLAAVAAPCAPCILSRLKKKVMAGGVLHRYDMESLYEGPELDLPKFIGKGYALCLVLLTYAAVLPVLYPIGMLFFAGSWFAERWALLRVHRTPPPYSFSLITSTLGWMPWAVCLHLGFAFWGFASLPAATIGNTPWVAPFQGQASGGATAALAGVAGSSSVVVTAFTYVWDLPGHVNSWPCTILFAAAAVLFVGLLAHLVRATPLYLPLAPIEAAVRACVSAALRRKASVSPNDSDDVIDPPFSQVLSGVSRSGVRELSGRILHEAHLKATLNRFDVCFRFTPTALMFRALGMHERIDPVTPEEWADAKPLFTKLTRAADVSYQPSFHPTYERAFVYMAEPHRLAAFVAAAENAKPKAKTPAEDDDDDSDYDSDDDKSSAGRPADAAALDERPVSRAAEMNVVEVDRYGEDV